MRDKNMSKSIYKHTISYDSNQGPTLTRVLYEVEDNSIDYCIFYDEDGDEVPLQGTDSFMKCLVYSLNHEELDDLIEKVKIEEVIGLNSLPNKIINRYYDKH